MSGVAPHDLEHHDPVVRLGRGVQPVDRLGGDAERSVEADADVGAADIVVDRLGHRDHRETGIGQSPGGDQRAVAADGHQRLDAVALELRDQRRWALGLQPAAAARGAEHRAAPRQHPAHRLGIQRDGIAVEHAVPAPPVPDDVAVELVAGHAHHRSECRIQPGTVAPAGEHPDLHGLTLLAGRRAFVGRHVRGHELSPGRSARGATRRQSPDSPQPGSGRDQHPGGFEPVEPVVAVSEQPADDVAVVRAAGGDVAVGADA